VIFITDIQQWNVLNYNLFSSAKLRKHVDTKNIKTDILKHFSPVNANVVLGGLK